MEQKKKTKVFVAMSGGVDSSVTAALLKEEGYDVFGVYMKCWSDEDQRLSVCTTSEDKRSAMSAAAKLGVPFEVWDFEEDYRRYVFQYFLDEYRNGRTPNPDVMCNKYIKFGMFLRRALEYGADYIATGHYVRKSKILNFKSKKKEFRLLKAKDENKDQSYFLYTLTQEQLNYCFFPLGNYKKSEVREMARKFDLPNAERKDSQGVCFVGHIQLPKILEKFMPLVAGPIVDSEGNELGKHYGLNAYTIGQRYGLNIGGTGPYFVAQKDYQNNTLIVGKENDSILYVDEIKVLNLHWISKQAPAMPLPIFMKLRYRQDDVKAVLEMNEAGEYCMCFHEKQKGVASGQAVVFYSGEEMLGGGIIDATAKINTQHYKQIEAIV